MSAVDTPFHLPDLERLHEGDPRWELVLRIASSASFRRAPRLREFLCFVCDHAIRGETAELTEQHLGIEVFKRSADYSTTEDNVVRAQARQVRAKLAEYFGEAGRDESLLLEIPKGSYVPVFKPKAGTAVEVSSPLSHQVSPRVTLPQSSKLVAAWVVAAVCLAGFLFVLWDDRTVRSHAYAKENSAALLPPFSWLFDGRPVTIVVADSGFGLYQDLIGHAATLDDYLNPRFFATNPPRSKDKEIRAFSERLSTRQFSSFADLALTQKIVDLAEGEHQKISIRFARDLHLRELAGGNFVFIGSAYSNPWVSLFVKRRNFRTSFDPQSRRGTVSNGQPRPGEAKEFVMKGEDGVPGSTFGVLAFLPADAESGNVLLLDGLNMEGTEAAGTFLTQSHAARSLMDTVDLKSPGDKRYLEVVVESKAIAGTTRDATIAAFRIAPARTSVR